MHNKKYAEKAMALLSATSFLIQPQSAFAQQGVRIASPADTAAFTYGTTPFAPMGGVYNSTITNLTAGQAGAVALSSQRSMHVIDDNSASLLSAVQSAIPAGTAVIGQVGITSSLNTVTLSSAPTVSLSSAISVSSISSGTTRIGYTYDDPCRGTKSRAVFSSTQATTYQVIASASAAKIYICAIDIVAYGAQTVGVLEGTTASTNCDTGASAVFGGGTAALGISLPANGNGIVRGNGLGTVWSTTVSSDAFCLVMSSCAVTTGQVQYVQQ